MEIGKEKSVCNQDKRIGGNAHGNGSVDVRNRSGQRNGVPFGGYCLNAEQFKNGAEKDIAACAENI